MTGLDFSEPALEVARRLAADCGHDDRLRVQRRVRRGRGPRRRALRPRVHRHRRARAGCPTCGAGRRSWPVAATRRAVVHPRGSSDAVVAVRPEAGRAWWWSSSRTSRSRAARSSASPCSYVEHEGELESPDIVSFNHGMAEIDQRAVGRGHAAHDVRRARLACRGTRSAMRWWRTRSGEFRLRDHPERLAASYTLQAVKG